MRDVAALLVCMSIGFWTPQLAVGLIDAAPHHINHACKTHGGAASHSFMGGLTICKDGEAVR